MPSTCLVSCAYMVPCAYGSMRVHGSAIIHYAVIECPIIQHACMVPPTCIVLNPLRWSRIFAGIGCPIIRYACMRLFLTSFQNQDFSTGTSITTDRLLHFALLAL
uniref:Uncharacterized protein n=1 Tax=Ixodes ricinus TaxID=34613 RepID=A0A6B0UDE2_IXORI